MPETPCNCGRIYTAHTATFTFGDENADATELVICRNADTGVTEGKALDASGKVVNSFFTIPVSEVEIRHED